MYLYIRIYHFIYQYLYIRIHYNYIYFFVRQVAGIVGRAELLCGLFTWLSILLYNHTIYAKNILRAWVAMFSFTICITAAMLCKETGITAIVSIKIAFLN